MTPSQNSLTLEPLIAMCPSSIQPHLPGTWWSLLALLAVLCLGVHSDASLTPLHRSARIRQIPHQILWSWERTEDLRGIDSQTTAIALLDQTIHIGLTVSTQPRLHAVAFPSSSQRIAVVRIEADRHALLDAETVRQTVAILSHTARQPSIAALQVDFDATRSQRAFYRSVLKSLRLDMHRDLPLSITALASWCSYDDWLGDLPVDEAVPMLFRTEPDRRRAAPSTPDLQISEPLCQSSLGVSTHEPWPLNITSKRLYIFPDQGWHRDLPLLTQRNIP